MPLIKLTSRRRELLLPEHAIQEIEEVRLGESGGGLSEVFDVLLTAGGPAQRLFCEPTTACVVAAAPGFYVLEVELPDDHADALVLWMRYPVIGWVLDIGVVSGDCRDSTPVVDPPQPWRKEHRSRLVIVDSGARQARRWGDDCWRCDLAAVLSDASGVKVELVGDANPWSSGAPIVTRKAIT